MNAKKLYVLILLLLCHERNVIFRRKRMFWNRTSLCDKKATAVGRGMQ